MLFVKELEGQESAPSVSAAPWAVPAQIANAAPASAALDLEWHKRRSEVVELGRRSSSVRLASLLLVLATSDRDHGSGRMVADVVNCAYVAGLLDGSIDQLAELLLDLHSAGIVAALPDGRLRITDLAALEHRAEVPGPPLRAAFRDDVCPEDASGSASRRTPRCYARPAFACVAPAPAASAISGMAAIAVCACLTAAAAVTLGFVGR